MPKIKEVVKLDVLTTELHDLWWALANAGAKIDKNGFR
jgi:hypothetical protein